MVWATAFELQVPRLSFHQVLRFSFTLQRLSLSPKLDLRSALDKGYPSLSSHFKDQAQFFWGRKLCHLVLIIAPSKLKSHLAGAERCHWTSYQLLEPITAMDESSPASLQAPVHSFGPLHILHPEPEHTHTIVLLHGRGSTGPEFAEDLFESQLSTGKTLQESLPGWRWVFPSSKTLWSTTFQEEFPSWFEAYSLTDTTARQDLQVEGIKDSVEYLSGILDDEIARLGGKSERLVLGGISQGGAVALWSLLAQKSTTRRLGACCGTSTWLPFAANLQRILAPSSTNEHEHSAFDAFIEDMVAPFRSRVRQAGAQAPCLQTPVFFGHGSDDAYVDVALGRAASKAVSSIGFCVEWKEYNGAEEEGHWLKVPEELEDLLAFLRRSVPDSSG